MIPKIFSHTIAAVFNSKGKILLVAGVLISLRCLWLWQPERQVRLHQQHSWRRRRIGTGGNITGFFDDGFRTPAGKDKVWALQLSREVLGQFIALEIKATHTTVTVEGSTGRARTLIRVAGTGMQLAETAKTAVNESNEPFEFTWKRRSWRPWDWGLTRVEHPLLHLSGDVE